jgi:hypothetical protein
MARKATPEIKIKKTENEKNNLFMKSLRNSFPFFSSFSKKGIMIKGEINVAHTKKIKSGISNDAAYVSKSSPAPNFVVKILSLIIAKKDEPIIKKAIKKVVSPILSLLIFKKLNICNILTYKNTFF